MCFSWVSRQCVRVAKQLWPATTPGQGSAPAGEDPCSHPAHGSCWSSRGGPWYIRGSRHLLQARLLHPHNTSHITRFRKQVWLFSKVSACDWVPSVSMDWRLCIRWRLFILNEHTWYFQPSAAEVWLHLLCWKFSPHWRWQDWQWAGQHRIPHPLRLPGSLRVGCDKGLPQTTH